MSEPEVEIPEPEPVMEEKLSPEPILVNTAFLKRLISSLTHFSLIHTIIFLCCVSVAIAVLELEILLT